MAILPDPTLDVAATSVSPGLGVQSSLIVQILKSLASIEKMHLGRNVAIERRLQIQLCREKAEENFLLCTESLRRLRILEDEHAMSTRYDRLLHAAALDDAEGKQARVRLLYYDLGVSLRAWETCLLELQGAGKCNDNAVCSECIMGLGQKAPD